jgi:DNA mismatch repair protein MutL
MSDIIRLLPDHVANQIAAGEVVQRPASVVKELMENAIDASANLIKLIFTDAGKTLIQVVDNGTGMSPTDARMSFERHATSKIEKAEDLFHLHTKGFRGEALASIAAIGHVDLKSRTKDTDLGTHIRIEGSEVVDQESVVAPIGTSVAVKRLFYNIPARRKFLKSDSVETRHILNEFQRIALAHPDIEFHCYHNDNEIYNLGTTNLRQRVVAIFGKKTNEKLVPIDEKTAMVSIKGFVAKPEFARKKRGEQFFFVNNRFIKSPYLNHAVQNAFEGLIQPGYHPSYYLYLTLDPTKIDINIHPTKTEVKFDDEKTLYAILRSTVRHSLGQYNVAPILDFEHKPELEIPYDYQNKPTSTPKIQVNPEFNPFKSGHSDTFSHRKEKQGEQAWEALYSDLSSALDNGDPEKDENILFKVGNESSSTFQIHNKYIISCIKSGTVYIHQNLAHQRILYEKYLEQITVKETMSQQLLFPLSISFSKTDILLISELLEELTNLGFVFDDFEDEIVTVKGIPVGVPESQVSMVLEQLLDDIKNDVPDTSLSPSDIMAKSLAKSLAIKTGTKITQEEQESLVNNLFRCKQPELSPFGKRTFITIKTEEVDQMFGR